MLGRLLEGLSAFVRGGAIDSPPSSPKKPPLNRSCVKCKTVKKDSKNCTECE